MIQKTTIVAVLLLLTVPLSWAQERAIRPVETNHRQALVIGNGNYAHAGVLRNPANDAKAIGRTLEQLGFKVTTLTDADERQMDQAIRKFGRQLRGGNGVGLFYYAGHGMQIDGENYLLPIDINPSNEFDVTYDAVPVGKLLGQMQVAENKMNIVILDACRNNPFARSFRSSSKGLAQVVAPTGSFISYATAPGDVAADGDGQNGLFTEKLLQHMQTPGLKLEEVFKRVRADVQRDSNNKQVPWDSSSVTGDFFFVPGASPQPTLAIARPPETSGVNLEDLRRRAQNEQQAKAELEKAQAQWQEWQARMQEDFGRVEIFEGEEVSAELKIEPWSRFLATWSADNPFSEEDGAMRTRAQARLVYWRAEVAQAPAPEGITVPPVVMQPVVVAPSAAPEIVAPPVNPEAEQLWARYQLARQRNLGSAATKYRDQLLQEHPESGQAIRLQTADLSEALQQQGLTEALKADVESLRVKHPRNGDVQQVVREAAAMLPAQIQDLASKRDFSAAEALLPLAARWGVSRSVQQEVAEGIHQEKLRAALAQAEQAIGKGDAAAAEQHYAQALQLGADAALIQQKRDELPLAKARGLINSGRLPQAEEYLLELELNGQFGQQLSELHAALQQAKEEKKTKELKVKKLLETKKCPNCDLSGANLSKAYLIGAELSGANLSEADLSEANLIGANLIGANLGEANLSEADLLQADLGGANLSKADLSEAKLIGADLLQADLGGANLSKADLIGANLRGASLEGAKFCNTTMFDGSFNDRDC